MTKPKPKQFNYPTTMLYGEGAVNEMSQRIAKRGFKRPLLVTDEALVKLKIADQVKSSLKECGLEVALYDGTHPNPIEEDVHAGVKVFKQNKCDCVVAVGGGSPMDVAKVIMVAATHEGPLEKYDDAKGGDQYITQPLPPLFAVATTAGTGSEVGRSGVIILKSTGEKTIIFHPHLLPQIAVLEPSLTVGLPGPLTAATGVDAFTHCLEAFLAPGFHPMADGIAYEGMRLVLRNLPKAIQNGKDLTARGEMLMAASMGATAFQKGLGMIHSMAHPLSSVSGLHHGLANALVLPVSIEWIETNVAKAASASPENRERSERLQRVQNLFNNEGSGPLWQSCQKFIESTGIKMGLRHHGVQETQLPTIAEKAFRDPCHQSNMIPVTDSKVFLDLLKKAY